MVEYFNITGVPGKYFTCTRYGLMSIRACGRNYAEAPEPRKWGKLAACIGCQIGATHVAGVEVGAAMIPLSAPTSRSIANTRVCVRCRRGQEDSSRFMGRMRLVRNRTICVSCYNREREVLHGTNAKGSRPKKWAGLYVMRLAKVVGDSAKIAPSENLVFDCAEAIFTIIRCATSSGPSVGWTATVQFKRDKNE